eukprot:TRINITY_DN33130_c0_g1_i1.p1 TRINITY_DN33130_c0_g1~~TRINITY_DN33130_c0_g1_i1.p1  ORF type:complete len:632 (+),score=114.71 TRINITY_DN33130_c0_g1_i1:229-2124(+)
MPKPPESVREEAAGAKRVSGGTRKAVGTASQINSGSKENNPSASRTTTPAGAGTHIPVGQMPQRGEIATGSLATTALRTPVAGQQHAPSPSFSALQQEGHSGEVFLMEMLAAMDQHMQQLRETQQGLVATVELACRRALDRNFGRLVLVGSAALRVETPGSDVDVVCFTRRDGNESVGLPSDILRRVHWALQELIQQYSDYPTSFTMELIADARTPILRVLWGPLDHAVAIDVSVDQTRPLDHIRWFQRVGAAPRPTEPPPLVAPLVTLTLRCVKWWLRQRQIPRTKEGGMPTLGWLLMAVHVCSLPETHEQAIVSGQRPMAALLASLSAFFRHYNSLERLDGVLQFAPDGGSSDFKRRSEREIKSRGPAATSALAELGVLDPTREGAESLNLVPRLYPATQLLLSHELSRASKFLDQVPKGNEALPGDSRPIMEELFRALPEGTNALPSWLHGQTVPALVTCGEVAPGSGIQQVEFGIIEGVAPRPGWKAPFLLRGDERSEVSVRICDIEELSGNITNHRPNVLRLSPSNFICRVNLEREGQKWRIDREGVQRYRSMRETISELLARREKLVEQARESAAAAKAENLKVDICNKDQGNKENNVNESSPKGLSNVTNLPSPSRSARTAMQI